MLDELGISYKENGHLVRGLDYYSDTIFEIKEVVHEKPLLGESQNTLIGGGRYDSLAGMLGGRNSIPGFGWAAGLDRLSHFLPSSLPKGAPLMALIFHIVSSYISISSINIKLYSAFIYSGISASI